jgi:bacterioferritin-associated ferredoxin
MIVCNCRNINESAIKTLINVGLNYKQIVEATGMTKQCGACAKELVNAIITCDGNREGFPTGDLAKYRLPT